MVIIQNNIPLNAHNVKNRILKATKTFTLRILKGILLDAGDKEITTTKEGRITKHPTIEKNLALNKSFPQFGNTSHIQPVLLLFRGMCQANCSITIRDSTVEHIHMTFTGLSVNILSSSFSNSFLAVNNVLTAERSLQVQNCFFAAQVANSFQKQSPKCKDPDSEKTLDFFTFISVSGCWSTVRILASEFWGHNEMNHFFQTCNSDIESLYFRQISASSFLSAISIYSDSTANKLQVHDSSFTDNSNCVDFTQGQVFNLSIVNSVFEATGWWHERDCSTAIKGQVWVLSIQKGQFQNNTSQSSSCFGSALSLSSADHWCQQNLPHNKTVSKVPVVKIGDTFFANNTIKFSEYALTGVFTEDRLKDLEEHWNDTVCGTVCLVGKFVLEIANCSFVNNNGDIAGGLLIGDSKLIMKDSVFKHNMAQFFGGAIFSYNSQLVISDCLFEGNQAVKFDGGAILEVAGKFSLMRVNRSPTNRDQLISCDLLHSNNLHKNKGKWPSANNVRRIVITSSYFKQNEAHKGGGGIMLVDHSLSKNNLPQHKTSQQKSIKLDNMKFLDQMYSMKLQHTL